MLWSNFLEIEDLSNEVFDYYFLDDTPYYCGDPEPHEPHDVETFWGYYTLHTCNGNPEYDFPIEQECGS